MSPMWMIIGCPLVTQQRCGVSLSYGSEAFDMIFFSSSPRLLIKWYQNISPELPQTPQHQRSTYFPWNKVLHVPVDRVKLTNQTTFWEKKKSCVSLLSPCDTPQDAMKCSYYSLSAQHSTQKWEFYQTNLSYFHTFFEQ
jgi:hypothetical protein